jgi:asparagine synthase (glutamine-hydrolysing)
MTRALSHRGPDGDGHYTDPQRLCGLAHNRLSIIDLSDAGSQPMCDSSGRLWLIFNGEIYNYRELAAELSDYPFRSHSDSETILAAYRKWGDDCVNHFVGIFAFAIWDEDAKRLFCARDHLGVKPFHYAEHGQALFFASEVKALLAAGVPARTDWESWASYLHHGIYDHANATFFAGVSSLAPGHVLVWQNGSYRIRRYWSLADVAERDAVSDVEACEGLHAILKDSVRLQLRSDVPLGVNLSGGLDSTALLALVDQSDVGEDSLNCFTAGFDDPRYDESGFAASVPRRKKWTQHVARLGPEQAWSMIDPLMWAEEAPFGGIGTLAYYNLHRTVRQAGVTVVLEGQGMDEMLAGYGYYRSPRQAGIYQDGSSFLRPETLSRGLPEAPDPALAIAQPYRSDLNNRLYRDVRHAKLPRVLRMNDRLSMAFGLELRPPFLDHRVVEYCFALPDEQKLRGETGKHVLRQLVGKIAPDGGAATPKRGVVTPQREWIRGPLRDCIQDVIASADFRASGVFDPQAVQSSFDSFCDGHGDNAFFIWQWLNYDAWRRAFRPAA